MEKRIYLCQSGLNKFPIPSASPYQASSQASCATASSSTRAGAKDCPADVVEVLYEETPLGILQSMLMLPTELVSNGLDTTKSFGKTTGERGRQQALQTGLVMTDGGVSQSFVQHHNKSVERILSDKAVKVRPVMHNSFP